MKTFSAKPETVQRDWYVVDASGKTLGRLCSELARRLRGKHKPVFTPHVDTGDYLVVVNAEKITVTGKKLWDDAHRLTPRGRNPQANLVWLGAGDRALAMNSRGELALLSLTPRGVRELARTQVVGETWAHPAFAGRCVVARSDREIVCVELP